MRILLPALALLLALPPTLADPFVLGIPDTRCQTPWEWRLHDYGPPAAADVVMSPIDGNLTECPRELEMGRKGPVCPRVESISPSGILRDLACTDTLFDDFDGDIEYALGGAFLVSRSGDGITSGGLVCFGIIGHHPEGATVTVTDLSGRAMAFSVTADYSRLGAIVPGEVDCGDGTVEPCRDTSPPPPSTLPPPAGDIVDTVNALAAQIANQDGATCNSQDRVLSCPVVNEVGGSCTVPFAPGINGAYVVYVGRPLRPATQGHVFL